MYHTISVLSYRVSILLLVLASVLWVLVVSSVSGDSLYHHIQKTSAFLAPPIAATFISAIFWTRATEPVSIEYYNKPSVREGQWERARTVNCAVDGSSLNCVRIKIGFSKLLTLKLLGFLYRDLNLEAPCTTIILRAH